HHYRVAMPEAVGAERQATKEVATYFMSSKDLKGLELIGEFVDYGIDSLKIEGRMKTALYLATVTRAYRGALDEIFSDKGEKNSNQVSAKWERELEKLPHRGYTTGFLDKEADGEDTYDTDRQSTGEYEMAGQVVDVDFKTNRFAMLCKNRLYGSESIELMAFGGGVMDVNLSEMKGMEGDLLPLANPGQIVWLEAPSGSIEPPATLMVARKKVITPKAVALSL
ncbi:MAG: U32 family peptidase, partial [SAR324 cluster bacterium]|nr:U32 family peptidase [SAR324 cluster bacterium]